MRESESRRRRRSKAIKDQMVPISDFGVCVLALAEKRRVKPAVWLSQRIVARGGKCTERAANRYISGTRRASSDALIVLLDTVN